jgi:hypothetical protein
MQFRTQIDPCRLARQVKEFRGEITVARFGCSL